MLTVAVRSNEADGDASVRGAVRTRQDVVVIALVLVSAASVVGHSFVELSMSPASDYVKFIPAVVYLALGVFGAMVRTRTPTAWVMIVWAWVMMVIALVTMLPTVGAPEQSAPVYHYLFHVFFAVVQVVLVAVLIRRLSRDGAASAGRRVGRR